MGISQIPSLSKAKILVVEDEPRVRDLVSRQLQGLGSHVTAVTNAMDALHLLSIDDGFDLLFTDVVLPGGLSGFELAWRAQRALAGDLLVLLTSGYPTSTFDPRESREPSLPPRRKPYPRHELERAVAGALRSRGAPAV